MTYHNNRYKLYYTYCIVCGETDKRSSTTGKFLCELCFATLDFSIAHMLFERHDIEPYSLATWRTIPEVRKRLAEVTRGKCHICREPGVIFRACSTCGALDGRLFDILDGSAEMAIINTSRPSHTATLNSSNWFEHPEAEAVFAKKNIIIVATSPVVFPGAHKQQEQQQIQPGWNTICPACGAQAYQGIGRVQCSNNCKGR